MACTFTIKDPKTGKEIESKLYKKLEEEFGAAEAEVVYRRLFGPQFKSLWGAWDTNPESYKRKDGNGNPLLDEFGEPLFKDVLVEYDNWKLNQENYNIKKFDSVSNKAAKRLQKIIETLTTRLENLKKERRTELTRSRLNSLINELVERISKAQEAQGYESYARNALKDIQKITRILQEQKDNLTPQDFKKIDDVLKAYKDIEDIISEAQELGIVELEEGKYYSLSKDTLDTLLKVQNEIYRIRNQYEEKALDFVTERILGNGEEWMANVKEYYRRSFVETAEGKRKKDESVQEHRQRVQEHVNGQMAENDIVNRKDAKTYVKNLLKMGHDIDPVSRWALNASQTTSPMLRALNAAILNTEDKAKLQFNEKSSKLNTLFWEYAEYQKKRGKTQGNPVEFYDFIAERLLNDDGTLSDKGSGYYVSRWHSEWYDTLAKIRKVRSKIKKESELDEVGNILKTDKNYQLYKSLGLLYKQNDLYDSDESLQYIAEHRYRLNDKWKQIREIDKKLLPAIKEYNRLQEIFEDGKKLTQDELQRLNKLDKQIFLTKEKKSILVAEASRLEDTLSDELFRFQDTLYIPAETARSKAAIEKELKDNWETELKLRTPSQYKSKQYEELQKLRTKDQNNPISKYYNAIMNSLLEADMLYGQEFKLRYRMIGKRKNLHERWSEDVKGFRDFWSLTKIWASERFKYKTGKDIDSVVQQNQGLEESETQLEFKRDNTRRTIKPDANGRENQHIPVFYRQRLDLEDQSFNVQDNTLIALQVAYNYKNKKELLPVLEMFMTLLENREVLQSAGFKTFVKNNMGKMKASPVPGSKNLTLEAARDLIAQRMFGQVIVEKGQKLGDISVRKMWNLWMEYIGHTLLGFNWSASISNRLLGGTLASLEGLGQEFYTYKDLMGAELDYNLDLAQIADDIGRPYPKSKTNLLGLIFDPLNDYSIGEHTYAYNNKFKALFNTNTLHGLNSMAEHNMHSLTMYSILRSVKVLDANGKYLDRKGGEPTDDIKKAMSLSEAYSRKKNGKNSFRLVVNPKVRFVQVRTGETFIKYAFTGDPSADFNQRRKEEEQNQEAIMHITRLIQTTNEDLAGSYSLRNAAPAQRYWWGQMLWNMRKFFPSSFRRRWQGTFKSVSNFWQGENERGNKKFFKDTEDQGQTATMQYDPRTRTMREGMYVTTLKYFTFMGYHGYKKVAEMFKRAGDDAHESRKRLLTMSKEEWNRMSMHEKANIRRTVGEFAVMALAGTLATLFKERGEDDDDYFFYHLAFFAARLNTELKSYTSLKEFSRLMATPATTTTMLERVGNLILQLQSDMFAGEFETYKSGKRKGDTKLGKNLKDLVPIWKHTEKWRFMPDILNYHYK
tara:strand:+ start:11 stop:4075 length:4065 start_codon:yes stop_codon:yes gene_type:complete